MNAGLHTRGIDSPQVYFWGLHQSSKD